MISPNNCVPKNRALVALAVVPGVIGVAVFGYYALVDWQALKVAYQHYSIIEASGGTMRALFAAESRQNIHRINLLADGTWTLLSAILAAIGLHGLSIPYRETAS
ncbi:MAG TPA: hypothetical protein VGK19_10580 [Capsulimonadaceae bacterium]